MRVLTRYSKGRFYASTAEWNVVQANADTLIDYLYYGLNPGSFYEGFFENDMMKALSHAHPSTSIASLKLMTNWLINKPELRVAYGDRAAVRKWLKMSEEERHAILVSARLIYSPQEETVLALQGAPFEDEEYYVF